MADEETLQQKLDTVRDPELQFLHNTLQGLTDQIVAGTDQVKHARDNETAWREAAEKTETNLKGLRKRRTATRAMIRKFEDVADGDE